MKTEITLSKLFAFVSLCIGGILILLTPPMCTPDENAHFLNAYTISYGDIFPEVQDNNIGKYVHNKVINFVSKYQEKFTDNINAKYNFTDLYFDSWLPDSSNEKSFVSSSQFTINPIGYVISAMGMFLGRGIITLFGDGLDTPYNLLVFGRIANLLFYSLVGYYAIKKTPILKKTMFLLLTMPMSLYLGSSINYDAILIPVCYLFFVNVLSIIMKKDDNITKKEIIVTLICVFFLFGIKLAYTPFLLLLFCIKVKKFGTIKKYIGCVISVIIVAFIAYVLPTILLKFELNGFSMAENNLINIQTDYLLSRIWIIPELILNSFVEFGSFYLTSFYGKLGLLDVNFPVSILSILMLCFVIVIFIDICNVQRITVHCRIAMIASLLISIIGIFTSMYVNWTPLVLETKGNVVSGVQGRYFIPLSMFFALIISNDLLKKDFFNKNIFLKKLSINMTSNIMLYGILTANCVYLTLIIFLRYW